MSINDRLTTGHLALGIAIITFGGAFTAGGLYATFKSNVDQLKQTQIERSAVVDNMIQDSIRRGDSAEKRLSRMERNIVRIADKVGATVESPQ